MSSSLIRKRPPTVSPFKEVSFVRSLFFYTLGWADKYMTGGCFLIYIPLSSFLLLVRTFFLMRKSTQIIDPTRSSSLPPFWHLNMKTERTKKVFQFPGSDLFIRPPSHEQILKDVLCDIYCFVFFIATCGA